MADIRDVALDAGVSIATVSRVFSGSAAVASATREAVLASAERLQYRADAGARSLRTRRTMTIGLIVGDILNPFFTELARAVEEEARRHGYLVIIGNSAEDPQAQQDYLTNLLERRVDAIILSPTRDPAPGLAQTLRSHPAAILLDRRLPDPVPSDEELADDGLPELRCVSVDGTDAIDELAADLALSGYRRPAIISGPTAISTGRERLDAFAAACRRHGLELAPERIFEGDFQADSGRRGMAALLAHRPDCVFIADNLMALGALDELGERGLRYPDDLGLAVYDDVPWFRHTASPMTVISQPVAELGRQAVRAALRRLEVAPPHQPDVPPSSDLPEPQLHATLVRRSSLNPVHAPKEVEK